MPIRVRCPKCEAAYQLADEKRGKQVRCQKCQTVFKGDESTKLAEVQAETTPTPKEKAHPAPKGKPETNVESKKPIPASRPTDKAKSGTNPAQPREVLEVESDSHDEPHVPKAKRSVLPMLLMGCGLLLFLIVVGTGVGGYFLYSWLQNKAQEITKATTDDGTTSGGSNNKSGSSSGEGSETVPTGTPYLLKWKNAPDKGKQAKIQRTESHRGSVKVALGGKTQEAPMNSNHEEVFSRTLLEGTPPLPGKFKENYEKAVVTGDRPETLPHQGKSIIYTLSGQNYTVATANGSALPPNTQTTLQQRGKSAFPTNLLPADPVRVGEKWAVPLELASVLLGQAVEPATSKMTGKLERVAEKNGKQIAVVFYDIHAVLAPSDEFPPNVAPVVDLKGTHEFVLDGSSTEGIVSLNGTLEAHSKNNAAPFDLTATVGLKEETFAEVDAVPDRSQPPTPPVVANWENYNSEKGQFSVEFPGKPTGSNTALGGSVSVTGDKGIVYSASWREYKGTPLANKTPQELLDNALKLKGGSQAPKKEIKLDEHPGFEVTVPNSRGKNLTARIFAVGTRTYDVHVLSPLDVEVPAETMNRFLNSFKLGGASAGSGSGSVGGIGTSDDAIQQLQKLGAVVTGTPEARSVNLTNTKGTQEEMNLLIAVKPVRTVNLGKMHTDKSIAALANVTDLQEVNLIYPTLTTSGIKELAKIPKLTSLRAYGCVTDANIEELAAIPNLTTLAIHSTEVTGKGLKLLSKCARLKDLELVTGADDTALTHLSACTMLERLNVQNLFLNPNGKGSGLKDLAGLSTVTRLDIGGIQIQAEHMKYLAELKQVRKLSISAVNLTDTAVPELSKFDWLVELDLFTTNISRDGVEKLRKALPKCKVVGK